MADGEAVHQLAGAVSEREADRRQGAVESDPPGKGRAARALRLAAWSLLRSKSYLGAYLRRQRSRLGAPKAITAAAHKLARIVYNLMRYGVAYAKQTEAAYADQVRERLERQLRRRAQELGFELRPVAPPVAPAVQP